MYKLIINNIGGMQESDNYVVVYVPVDGNIIVLDVNSANNEQITLTIGIEGIIAFHDILSKILKRIQPRLPGL